MTVNLYFNLWRWMITDIIEKSSITLYINNKHFMLILPFSVTEINLTVSL